MSVADHIELLDVLTTCKGQVVLSRYPSTLYDERLSVWNKVCVKARSHVANSGEPRVEVLWTKIHDVNDEAAEKLVDDLVVVP